MGGVQGRVQLRRRLMAPGRPAVHRLSLPCRRRLSGACRRRLAITLENCCDWLQHCLMNIPTRAAKIILFHFTRGSM